MRNISNLIGIILIIIGIVTLAYKGITYTKHEPIAQIGDVTIAQDTTKTVYITPWLGALSLGAGAFLVVVARRGGNRE